MNKVIEKFLEKGYLVTPELAKKNTVDFDRLMEHLDKKVVNEKPTLINEDLYLVLTQTEVPININFREFEKAKAMLEKGNNGKSYYMFLDILEYNISPEKKEIMDNLIREIKQQPTELEEEILDSEKEEIEEKGNVIVIDAYEDIPKKREIQDFVEYLKVRYNRFKEILYSRPELQDAVSISRIKQIKAREQLSVIGVVSDLRMTKNGNIILELEDLTGVTKVLINKNRGDLFEKSKSIVLDEVIGVRGVTGNDIIFANEVVFADVPISKELKKSEDEAYAVFTSDLHVGSNLFMEENLLKFIKWINGESGNKEQRKIASKVKYLFIAGDLIDGCGIYPSQYEELNIRDAYEQYEKVDQLLGMIREDIQIVLIGGNHDALRLAEPQPVLDKKYAKPLWSRKNVVVTTNPSIVNIHANRDFGGFNVLLYHGFSFNYFADNVDFIRLNGGTHNPENIMKFLLQKRHLAPTHTSSLYIPDSKRDYLIIDKIPDFFVTGHLHRVAVENYKNITMIAGGCWQAQTAFMDKVGVEADPGKVVLANLQTRDVKILNFLD